MFQKLWKGFLLPYLIGVFVASVFLAFIFVAFWCFFDLPTWDMEYHVAFGVCVGAVCYFLFDFVFTLIKSRWLNSKD